MSARTLEQLFMAFVATGETAAFELLMRRSAPELRRLARRLGAGTEDAEDLVQETMVAAIQAADRYDPQRPLLPWLRGILTYRACRLARDEARRRAAHARSSGSELQLGRRDLTSAPQPAVARELDADVQAAIDGLPSAYREPLRQFLLAERSPVEIAAALGVGRATVRVRLHRGLQRLRERLARWRGAVVLCAWRPTGAAGRSAVRWPSVAVFVFVLSVAAAWPVLTGGPAAVAQSVAAASDLRLDDAAAAAPRIAAAAAGAVESAARVAAALECALEVLVRDADGQPVASVGLALAPEHGLDPVLHRRRAVTDAHGRARFDRLRPGAMALAADRGVTASVDIVAGDNVHQLRMGRGVPVQGRVVDDRGRSVAGASVWLSSDATAPWRGDDVTATDDDGRFALAHVQPGAFLVARHASLCCSDLHRSTADGDRDVELRLGAPGGRATVVVRDAAGRPVADALVFVGEAIDAMPLWLAQGAAPFRAPPFEGRTDADGVVHTAALALGRQPVFVRAAGCTPYTGQIDIARERACEHVVELRRCGQLRGRVVDRHDLGIAGATAVFRCGDPTASIDLQADGAGAFLFECLPAGGGEIAVRARGWAPRTLPVDTAPTDHALRIELTPLRRLIGSVSCGGRVVAGTVRAQWPESMLGESMVDADVAADGTFDLAAGDAERPRLQLRRLGEPLWRAVDAWADWAGDSVRVQLPVGFAASSWLTGSLRCADGRPLAAARLFVRGAEGWAEIGRSAADGTFRLGPLPHGDYDLFAETTAQDLPTAAVGRQRLAVGEERCVEFTAGPTGTLELDFERSDGQRIGDLAVTVVGIAPERRFALATGDRLRQVLLPGDYLVFAMGSRVQWLERLRVHVDAGAVTRQRVALTAARRCTIVVEGLPPPSAARPRTFALESATGVPWSGTYTLPPDAPLRLAAVLGDGSYVLRHEDTDGRRWLGTFDLPAGAEMLPRVAVRMAPE